MPTASELTPELREFMLTGTRTAKIGYIGNDGRPLIAPVWFTLDGDDVVFCTGATTAKGRALRRDPRIVVCVDLQEPPYAFVQVQGHVELSEDVAEARRISTIVGGRYMGADRAEEFGARNGVPGEYTVRVKATRLVYELDASG
jgi:PPOX class probable F420-dependent enzyme